MELKVKDALANFDRSSLRRTETTITTSSGRKMREIPNEFGRRELHFVSDNELGFVANLRMDFQVIEVCPGVTMGSQDVAQDFDLLMKHKITHILNVATLIKNEFPEHFVYKSIDIRDLPSINIIQHFDETNYFIHNAVQSGGRVYVHCNAGVSRSATIVIAYLMKYHDTGFRFALASLRGKRSAISPNAGFMVQLEVYEEKLAKGE